MSDNVDKSTSVTSLGAIFHAQPFLQMKEIHRKGAFSISHLTVDMAIMPLMHGKSKVIRGVGGCAMPVASKREMGKFNSPIFGLEAGKLVFQESLLKLGCRVLSRLHFWCIKNFSASPSGKDI